jgi:hypothetical protein
MINGVLRNAVFFGCFFLELFRDTAILRKQGKKGGSVLAHVTDMNDEADEESAPKGEQKKRGCLSPFYETFKGLGFIIEPQHLTVPYRKHRLCHRCRHRLEHGWLLYHPGDESG